MLSRHAGGIDRLPFVNSYGFFRRLRGVVCFGSLLSAGSPAFRMRGEQRYGSAIMSNLRDVATAASVAWPALPSHAVCRTRVRMSIKLHPPALPPFDSCSQALKSYTVSRPGSGTPWHTQSSTPIGPRPTGDEALPYHPASLHRFATPLCYTPCHPQLLQHLSLNRACGPGLMLSRVSSYPWRTHRARMRNAYEHRVGYTVCQKFRTNSAVTSLHVHLVVLMPRLR